MRQDLAKIRAVFVLVPALLLAAEHSVGSEAGGARFESALRESGWEVKRLQDGSIELRRGSLALRETEPAEAIDAVAAEGKESDPEASAWDRLRETGWRVEEGSDGSAFLHPPAPETETETGEGTSKREPRASMTEGLDAQLAEGGWRVERAADGSLLLYPKATRAPAASPSNLQPCEGAPSTPVESSKITLPVDRWGEAKEIAESWLASSGAQGLTLGRIRRMLQVFVVSIVESNPPHRLRHQIAINAADGRVIVLN